MSTEMQAQLDRIEGKLDAFIDAIVKPAPKGQKRNPSRLSDAIRLGIQRMNAARARAAKPVGRGRGAVKSRRTKRKLEREVS